MKLLDGRKLAQDVLREIKEKIKEKEIQPGLGVVLVGDDEASRIYVSLKEKAAKETGMIFKKRLLEKDSNQKKIIQAVQELNQDKEISGIIVQLPLPDGINENKVIESIDPQKDADGFHRINLEKFFAGQDTILPVFPEAILALIKSSEVDLKNKKSMIVVNSEAFGRTMQKTLENNGVRADYFLGTDFKDEKEKLKRADIIITACGVPNLISAQDVKDESTVIDGGISKENSQTVGDVNQKTFENRNIFLSPVPGGVGPLTIAYLLKNVYNLSRNLK